MLMCLNKNLSFILSVFAESNCYALRPGYRHPSIASSTDGNRGGSPVNAPAPATTVEIERAVTEQAFTQAMDTFSGRYQLHSWLQMRISISGCTSYNWLVGASVSIFPPLVFTFLLSSQICTWMGLADPRLGNYRRRCFVCYLRLFEKGEERGEIWGTRTGSIGTTDWFNPGSRKPLRGIALDARESLH